MVVAIRSVMVGPPKMQHSIAMGRLCLEWFVNGVVDCCETCDVHMRLRKVCGSPGCHVDRMTAKCA